MPEEKERTNNKENYFVVIRTKFGGYVSRSYKSENDFKVNELKIGELLIVRGVSKEDAEKKCLDYNDSHIIGEGLEKYIIR